MKNFFLFLFIALSVNVWAQEKNKFTFNEGGKFKLVQFTDVHYVKGSDVSVQSLDAMNVVLDQEKPDLVIFTGDIVTGNPAVEGWNDVLKVVIDKKIPYIVTFGNHDHEVGISNEDLAKMILEKPYCMNEKGSASTYGCFNGVVALRNRNNSKPEMLVYYINSNDYSKFKDKGIEGYGCIERDQIDWYEKQSQKFASNNNNVSLPSLMFFHIAIPEFVDALGNDKTKYVGIRLEKECNPELNSGLFNAMMHQGGVMGVFVGHDHNNDYISSYGGMALGYGRFTGSKNTYQDLMNGARVFELDESKPGEFVTWIKLSDGSIHHKLSVKDGKFTSLSENAPLVTGY
ncbi:MAG: metallophosphoesterase family protein [Bacteroidales bacterium]|nr:metallophosphoesterase family protein [Bacteroidales bacterium]